MAKTKTIKASEMFEPVNVDVWGQVFPMREMNLALEDQISDLWSELEESDKPVKEELDRFLEFIDLFMEPVEVRAPKQEGEAEGAMRTLKPSESIKRQLDAGKIGMTHVMGLARELLARGQERPI